MISNCTFYAMHTIHVKSFEVHNLHSWLPIYTNFILDHDLLYNETRVDMTVVLTFDFNSASYIPLGV